MALHSERRRAADALDPRATEMAGHRTTSRAVGTARRHPHDRTAFQVPRRRLFIEEITADVLGENGFNANNDESGATAFDSRSDDKGPEPEGVAVGRAFGRTLAFVGLERVGGVMTYDVTNPHAPQFLDYANDRDFDAPTAEQSVDLGPEGGLFIPAGKSPNGAPLLVLSHEVTGTTTIYQVGLDRPTPRR